MAVITNVQSETTVAQTLTPVQASSQQARWLSQCKADVYIDNTTGAFYMRFGLRMVVPIDRRGGGRARVVPVRRITGPPEPFRASLILLHRQTPVIDAEWPVTKLLKMLSFL